MSGTPPSSPFQPLTEEARDEARTILREAQSGSLGVLLPESGLPHVSRVGLATLADMTPLIFVSSLAVHTGALLADPRCSLLVVRDLGRGDPLTHPRLTLACTARQITGAGETVEAKARFLAHQPKAKIYADLPDFRFFALEPDSISFNGGFGRAYKLTRGDLMTGA